ncbi:MAG: hypothetical protein GWP14_09655 [Actinobacteria bacterium]|nr:hypothetical protein [Actinomycetota bacterium]
MRTKEAKIFYISGDRLDKFPSRVGPSRGSLAKAGPDEIVQALEDQTCPRCASPMDVSGTAGLCEVCGFRF